MLQALFAAETGEETSILSELRANRWRSLAEDPGDGILVNGDAMLASLSSLDVDSRTGELLLAAGTARFSLGQDETTGCVGVYGIGGPRKHPQGEDAPLAWANAPPGTGNVTVARWMPRETALFVTATTSGTVSAWDAETFEPCSTFSFPRFQHGDGAGADAAAPVAALDMSSAPGARGELIAVASATDDVKLLDLNSGAFAHTLSSGHTEGLTDVRWSPTSAHLLATAGRDGSVRMFDVRRAGTAACLCIYDKYKTLSKSAAKLQEAWSLNASTSPGVQPMKGPRITTQSSSANTSTNKNVHDESISHSLLGLGMAWEHADDSSGLSQRKRLARRRALSACSSSSAGQSGCSHSGGKGGAFRVRFTADGCRLLTGGGDARVRVWDALTGHCLLSSFAHCREDVARVFEPSRDGTAVMFGARGAKFTTHDVETGRLVTCLRAHYGAITSLAVHPLRQEVYSGNDTGGIVCWSPRRAKHDVW